MSPQCTVAPGFATWRERCLMSEVMAWGWVLQELSSSAGSVSLDLVRFGFVALAQQSLKLFLRLLKCTKLS